MLGDLKILFFLANSSVCYPQDSSFLQRIFKPSLVALPRSSTYSSVTSAFFLCSCAQLFSSANMNLISGRNCGKIVLFSVFLSFSVSPCLRGGFGCGSAALPPLWLNFKYLRLGINVAILDRLR